MRKGIRDKSLSWDLWVGRKGGKEAERSKDRGHGTRGRRKEGRKKGGRRKERRHFLRRKNKLVRDRDFLGVGGGSAVSGVGSGFLPKKIESRFFFRVDEASEYVGGSAIEGVENDREEEEE